MNTKYISKSAMKNQYSVVSLVSSTSENADIFIAQDEIYLVLSETKNSFYVNFSNYSFEMGV